MRIARLLLFCVIGLGAVAATGGVAFAKKNANGQPAFKAGDPEAFWIWFAQAGWHLRATTAKKQHTFRGVVRGDGIGQLKATRPALSSKLNAFGNQVKFEFDLFTGVDGFDWQQTEECATFELRLDGQARPDRIHVGGSGEQPSEVLFIACKS